MKINPLRWLSAAIMSLRREEQQPHPEGTVWLGGAAGGGPHDDVVASSRDTGQSCRVCFRNRTDETLLVCWVSETGEPHHFYALHPVVSSRASSSAAASRGRQRLRRGGAGSVVLDTPTEEDHVETTVEGHAFLIVAAENVEAVQKQKSLKAKVPEGEAGGGEVVRVTIVGAYRPEKRQQSETKEEQNDNDSKSEYETVHLVEVVDPRQESQHQQSRLHHLFTCCLPFKRKLDDEEEEGDNEGGSSSSTKASRYVLRARKVQVDDSATPKIDTTTKYYETAVLGQCQWPVRLEPQWNGSDDDPELPSVLARDLDHMASCLPRHALVLLRDEQPTPLWVNRTFQYGPQRRPQQLRHLCYHPGRDWLVRHRMHPAKAGSVECYRAADYRQTRTNWGTGGLLLHEFSHAFHHKGCKDGYANREIRACYQRAMEEGLYECVRVHSSGSGTGTTTAKAYACTNEMEYWAELSTAFLGGTWARQRARGVGKDGENDEMEEFNKWFPFNRQQIREHDPRAHALLKRLWKVDDDDDEQ